MVGWWRSHLKIEYGEGSNGLPGLAVLAERRERKGRVERPKKARNHVSKIPFKENLTSIPVLLNQDSLK